jgi:hypothetical protein
MLLRSNAFTFLVLILHLASSSTAVGAGSNCLPSADLSKDLGEVYDQGETLEWCYSYALADAITQKMRAEDELKPGERIHPVGLAASHHIDQFRSPAVSQKVNSTAGGTYDSLLRMSEYGFKLCKESEFGSLANEKHPLFGMSEATAMRTFRTELQDQSAKDICGLKGEDHFRALSFSMNEATWNLWKGYLLQKCQTPLPSFNPDGDWVREKYKPLAQNIKNPKWPKSANERIRKKIDEALNRGRLASIEYQAGFNLSTGQHFMHWSSIVERKPINGICHYRIRDSYGKNCARFKHPDKCQDGYIWVEQRELLDHTDAVFSVD